MTKYIRVTMPDGSQWDVPLNRIEQSMQERYRQQGDFSEEELIDHAENSMNWSHVMPFAIQSHPPQDVRFRDGWVNGKKEIIEK